MKKSRKVANSAIHFAISCFVLLAIISFFAYNSDRQVPDSVVAIISMISAGIIGLLKSTLDQAREEEDDDKLDGPGGSNVLT